MGEGVCPLPTESAENALAEAQTADAHAAIEARATLGKTLLEVSARPPARH